MNSFYLFEQVMFTKIQHAMTKVALFLSFSFCIAFSSIAQVEGDFKSVVSGDWNDNNTWRVYDGLNWEYASDQIPTENSTVYIEASTTVTLDGKAFVKDLYIHEEAHLDLGADTLEVWGQLIFYADAFPVTNAVLEENPSGKWISSGAEGLLSFRGTGRTVVVIDSGGASNGLAGYNMEIALEEDEEAIIEKDFRVGNLTVRSGILKVDADYLYAGEDATVSGNITIGEHALFYPPTVRISRTGTAPIANLTLDSLATMMITRSDLVFAAGQIDFLGTVIVEESSGISNITLPTNGSIPGAALLDTYTNLLLQGTSDITLSSDIVVNGILTKPDIYINGGTYTVRYGPDGGLEYVGVDESTDDFLFPEVDGPAHLIINNSKVYLHENRILQGQLALNNSILYVEGNTHLTFSADSPPIAGDFSVNNFILLDSEGSLRKEFAAPGSFYFPIGNQIPVYTPVALTVNSADFTPNSYLEVKMKGGKYAFDNSVNYINRHWVINSTLGNLNIDGVFHYDVNDAVGNEASIMAYIYGNAREEPLSLADAVAKTLSFNNVSTSLDEFYIAGSNKCNVTDDWITVTEGNYCGSVDLDLITGSDAITGDPINNKYEWQQQFNSGGWTSILNTDQRDYDPELLTTPGFYEFRRVVTTSGCPTPHMSNIFAFTLYPEVENFNIAEASTEEFCLTGTGFDIIGELPTGGDGNFSYAWERSKDGESFVPVGDDSKDYYETEELGPGTYTYRREVISTTCGTLLSDSTIVKVYDEIKNHNITTTPFEHHGIPSEIVLKSAAILEGGSGRYTFVWERRKVGEGEVFQVVGDTEELTDQSDFELSEYRYRRTVIDDLCGEKTSNELTVIFYPELSDNIIDTEEIVYCSAPSGFTIEGDGVSGGKQPYTYTWQRSKNGGAFQAVLANVGNTNYVENEPLTPGEYLYRRIAIASLPNGYDTSEVKLVRVLTPITGNTLEAPLGNEYCGVPESITIMASIPENGDGSYGYIWERSIDGGDFYPVPGGTEKDLIDMDLIIPGSYSYRRLVTSGNCEPVSSDTITIIVYPELSENSLASVADYCTSASGIVIEGSTMTGGDNIYSYIWEKNINDEGFLAVAGDQKDYIETETLAPGKYQYRRTVNSAVCSSESEVFTINVYPPISGNTIEEPTSAFFCGTSGEFTITGTMPEGGDGTFHYSFERKIDDGAWEVLTSNAMSFTETGLNTPGIYHYRRLVSSASCDEVVSNTVTILVSEPIVLSATITETHNSDKTGAILLEVTGGTPPYDYIWSEGQSTQNISNIDAGEHTVKVLDAYNCEASATYMVPRILGLSDSPYIESYKLYPNPVKETLYIQAEFLKTFTSEVYIINSVGQVLRKLQTSPSNKLDLEVDMQSYPAGIYFVRMIVNGKVETWKFIKQ